ncbi:hypothetical protein SLS62_009824 [Diatrype stigma]|uniref:Thioester reductase (TE) domain-containing protein n=1 Tax=Diatrype stigma TaxID=117547 RepID=A0AAN9UC76_9PEZI
MSSREEAGRQKKGSRDDEFGHRLIQNVIDDVARTNPHKECFSIPRSSDPADGWSAITFKQYANAINRVARLIIDGCGQPPSDSFPTIAYIGPNDARYLVMLVAAVKAGEALFISPRNPKEAQMNLFDKTQCRIMCFPASYRSTVEPWLQEREMSAVQIGPIDDCFRDIEVQPVPYDKDFEQAEPSILKDMSHSDDCIQALAKLKMVIFGGDVADIIVLSNGEKLNPTTIEEIIGRHSQVKAALVFGTGRFQPGLLIEPLEQPKDDEDASSLIKSIWPFILNANKQTVGHGQIARQLIMLTDPDKPFLYGGKGTVQRGSTLKQYEKAIDELFKKVDKIPDINSPSLDISSEEALTLSIVTMFQEMMGTEKAFEPETDLFAAGIDSLQVVNASRQLRSMINDGRTSRLEEDKKHELQIMRDLWKKYTQKVPVFTEGRPQPADDNQVILLTGSTGMLGSYLLDRMVQNAAVKKIICLNRAEDGGEEKQARAMHDRGLTSDYASKVEFWHSDLSRPDLGLPHDAFAYLLEVTDRVIHNAWEVNLNIPVASFEPHLRGIRHLADFAAQARKRVAVVFVSSISTVDRWVPAVPDHNDDARGRSESSKRSSTVPEERLEDLRIASSGYGRSKLIGSLILDDIAQAAGFPAAIVRIGQITGPEAEHGHWNKREWLPSLIASSLYLKALPAHLGSEQRVDWTPSETIADLVLDVGGVSQRVSADKIHGYYHGVNPSATTWDVLAPAVRAFYGESRIAELVGFGDWIDRLERSPVVDGNPAVRLVNLYRSKLDAYETRLGRGHVVLDMTRTLKRSPAMRSALAVTPRMMRHWCSQWGF